MNLSKHFLLIEFKRKMFYKLQDVMSFKFNIIQDIYELIRLTQLKENHYKRIDDVKSRRRSNAIITAKIEIETKTTISKIVNIITISTSINEKVEQIFAKQRSEILINFVSRRLESFLEHLISIRLKKNL
jgi:vacuolar-type H+-ATPase catalytic subunit A/Vma1